MMKKIALIVLAAGSVALSGCGSKSKSSANLKTDVDSLSYAIGISVGSSFAQNDISEISPEALAAAVEDVMSKDSSRAVMTPQIAQVVIQSYMMKQFDLKHEKEIQAAKDFMVKNASKPGVDTMNVAYLDMNADGTGKQKTAVMQYEVITKGTGVTPAETDMVKVHYTGTLADGTKFDSSYDRKAPASFRLNGVIRGWTAGLQKMTVGSKYKFYIPSELAYGRFGRQPLIPPYAVLVFEIELLSIEAPAPEGK